MVREDNQRKFIDRRWATISSILEQIGNDSVTDNITERWYSEVAYPEQGGDLENASYAASNLEDYVKVVRRQYFAMTPCPYCEKDVKIRMRLSCNTCRECNKII
jgi:hypothetical protein